MTRARGLPQVPLYRDELQGDSDLPCPTSKSHGVGKDTTIVIIWLTLRPPGPLKTISTGMVGRKLEWEGGKATGTRSPEINFSEYLVEKGGRNRFDGISLVRRDGCLKGTGRGMGGEMKEVRKLDNQGRLS